MILNDSRVVYWDNFLQINTFFVHRAARFGVVMFVTNFLESTEAVPHKENSELFFSTTAMVCSQQILN